MGLSIEERFNRGVVLRDQGRLNEAGIELLHITRDFKDDRRIDKVYIVLAGVYRDLGDMGRSCMYFKKASELNPSSELASLGLYLAYVKLGEDDEAIAEISRYLSHNRADLYKDALQELSIELTQGRLEKYRTTILKLLSENTR